MFVVSVQAFGIGHDYQNDFSLRRACPHGPEIAKGMHWPSWDPETSQAQTKSRTNVQNMMWMERANAGTAPPLSKRLLA